jgi:hypothetical protein
MSNLLRMLTPLRSLVLYQQVHYTLDVRVTAAERDLIERFVQFLNMSIARTTEVEELFGGSAIVTGSLMRIGTDEADAYRGDQAGMRALVQPLADAFSAPRRRRQIVRVLEPQIQAGLADKPFPARFTFERGTMHVTYAVNGVLLCCWIAVGLLIDRERGLLGRFGRCGACGRFTITYNRKPRRHCSPEHAEQFRRQTGAKRVARWRARRRKEGR